MSNSNSSYRRVSTSSDETSYVGGSNAETSGSSHSSTPPRRSLSERITDKIVAAVWVAVAIIIAYLTNTFQVLLNPAESGSNRLLLQLSAVGFGINTVLLLYLIVYLPYVKKLNDSSAWEVYCPNIIPVMTFTGFIVGVLLIRATWPVWGFLSPLILGIEAFGCLFSLHFIPAFPC
jgi:hypothetical protein